MKKISKTLAMLLIVAAIVCVAGCWNKNTTNSTQSSIASGNINKITSAANVAEDNTIDVNVTNNNSTYVSVADYNLTDDNLTDQNATDMNATDDNSIDVPLDNSTT